MAGGIANMTNLANSIRELYFKPFVSLRDETNYFLSRIDKKPWPKKTIDTLIRDAYYTPVWSVAEANMTDFITSSIVATDGLGTSTLYLAPNNHPFVKFSASMAINYASIEVNGLTKAALASSNAAYVNAMKDETETAIKDFWRGLNVQASATSKVLSTDMDNVGTMFATGSYGGINQATWNPSIDAATTTLSIGAMQTLWNKIQFGTETLTSTVGATATIREGEIKEIWCHATQMTNYLNLLSGQRIFSGMATLDGGVKNGNSGVTFNGVPLQVIPRFPLAYMIFYSGGLYEFVLEEFAQDELSQNFTDATFIRIKRYSNLAFLDRKRSGLFNALT
jgi:hypothetical protein